MPRHIIYVHTHDTGRYLQPYGYAVPTPHLQRLAGEGTLFRRAFAAAPTCSPSRAGLLTSNEPHAVGMLGLAHMGFRLADYSRTLVSLLNGAGYDTVLCGGQHIAPPEEIDVLGYRHRPACEFNPTAAQAVAHAVTFLRGRDRSRPFFLDVGAFETHRYQYDPQDKGHFALDGPQGVGTPVRPPEGLPDAPEVRRDWADFCAAARRVDDALGLLLAELEAQDLLDETLLVFTTDHGVPFPGMKCTLSDGGLNVALMMRGPGIPAGRTADALVSQLDVLPTLCELAGLPVPDWARGRSLLPVLRHDRAVRQEVFGGINYHGPGIYLPQRCVRTDRHRLVQRWPGDDHAVRRCCDDSPTKTLLARAGWTGEEPAEALYDLLLDPTEARNLIADEAHAAIADDLRGRLHGWMRETGDPLLAVQPQDTGVLAGT